MLKTRERRKAAQPMTRVVKTVVDVMGWECPSVSSIVMVSPDLVMTRVTTVTLETYCFDNLDNITHY